MADAEEPVVQESDQKEVAPAAETQQPPKAEPDYKALYEQQKLATEKAERETLNYRAQDIQNMKRLNLEAAVEDVREGQGLLVEHLGDPDLQAKWTARLQARSKQAGTEEFVAAQAAVGAKIVQEAEALGVDPYKELEFENVRGYWQKADREKSLIALTRVETELERTARKLERIKHREEKTQVEAAAEAKVRGALKKAGVHDLGLEPTGSVSGTSDKTFKERWGSGDLPATKENMERAQKLLAEV